MRCDTRGGRVARRRLHISAVEVARASSEETRCDASKHLHVQSQGPDWDRYTREGKKESEGEEESTTWADSI